MSVNIMNIYELQKTIEYDYKKRNIKRRFSALYKVITFLKYTFPKCTDDINFIKNINKKELQKIYKATNKAEYQVINDIYNYLTNTIIKNITLQESQAESFSKKQTNKHFKEGLVPWVGKNPKVLILGTLPGDTSIQQKSYYSDSSNSFWEIMTFLFFKEKAQNNKEFITAHRIALWDCIKSGIRIGSLDNGFDTNSIISNDLKSFLKKYPSIKAIILNGKSKGRKEKISPFYIIKKYSLLNNCNIPIIRLNSTSNLNTHKTIEEKKQEWSIIKDLVENE